MRRDLDAVTAQLTQVTNIAALLQALYDGQAAMQQQIDRMTDRPTDRPTEQPRMTEPTDRQTTQQQQNDYDYDEQQYDQAIAAAAAAAAAVSRVWVWVWMWVISKQGTAQNRGLSAFVC
jgi:hypothetical protein